MADSRNETVIIPIAHEELVTSTREVETGRVRVKTLIDEHEEIIRQELARSTVEVEHVAIDREVDEIPVPRMEGDTYIIPVVKEVLFVRKALVLTEEVRLHRKTFTEQVEQPVTVRSQRAVVEREGSAGHSGRQTP
jgi:stress response protein YsnF